MQLKLNNHFEHRLMILYESNKKSFFFCNLNFYFKVLHTEKDLGLFYTVNPEDLKRISPFGKALPLQFREEVK